MSASIIQPEPYGTSSQANTPYSSPVSMEIWKYENTIRYEVMGERARKLEAFLAAHPKCCFCGGMEPNETMDHVPPRAAFTRREWPEGFVFPACKTCNERTRGIEQVIALYAHIGVGSPDPDREAAFSKLVRGVRNNNPGLLPDPRISAIEKRKFLKRTGFALPGGATTDDLILARLPKDIQEHFAPFWIKLYCALYYKELKVSFPATGTVSAFFTPAEYARREAFEEVFNLVPNQGVTIRQSRDLSKDFSYRFSSGENGRVFVSLIHLGGRSLIFAGGVTDRDFERDGSGPKWRDIFGIPLQSDAA